MWQNYSKYVSEYVSKKNPSRFAPGGGFLCLDGVFHSIPDLSSLRVVETLQRADKVPGDAPDTLELHTLARLPTFNAESVPRPA